MGIGGGNGQSALTKITYLGRLPGYSIADAKNSRKERDIRTIASGIVVVIYSPSPRRWSKSIGRRY